MNEDTNQEKATFLLAWTIEEGGSLHLFFEHSTALLCREQGVVKGGIRRDGHTVVAFCDYIHGEDYLSKKDLQSVATCYLDGHYSKLEIDLRR